MVGGGSIMAGYGMVTQFWLACVRSSGTGATNTGIAPLGGVVWLAIIPWLAIGCRIIEALRNHLKLHLTACRSVASGPQAVHNVFVSAITQLSILLKIRIQIHI